MKKEDKNRGNRGREGKKEKTLLKTGKGKSK